MIDAQDIIRDYLLTDTPLVALVGSRIHAGRNVPPPGYQEASDGDCLTFRVRGGRMDYEDALVIPSVQFKFYSTSEAGAQAGYRALYDALHGATSGDILHAEIDILGQTLEEPGTQWVFVLAFFTIMLRGG